MAELSPACVVVYADQGAVAVVTLNRLLALNSFTRKMHQALAATRHALHYSTARTPHFKGC
jgi:enoyl-CoA hydratase/carnithine racemase